MRRFDRTETSGLIGEVAPVYPHIALMSLVVAAILTALKPPVCCRNAVGVTAEPKHIQIEDLSKVD